MKTPYLKPVVWIGASRKVLKTLPFEVQSEIGFALFRAQEGLKPHHEVEAIERRLRLATEHFKLATKGTQ